jgi:superfamily II DNA or RNA helicase
MTPRIIACFEEQGDFLLLPRGCASEAKSLLADNGFDMAIEDQRYKGVLLDVVFTGDLSPIQAEAGHNLKDHDIGVIVAPPGIGKTVVACWLIAERKKNTLVVVHRKEIFAQWVVQLEHFLGLARGAVGLIRGGMRHPNGKLDVAMLQSLVRRGEVDPIVEEYGQIVVDECHHIPAFTFERVLSKAKAFYVLGLTATPQRRDGQHPIIKMQLGPARFAAKSRTQSKLEPFRRRLVVRRTQFKMERADTALGIQQLYSALAADEDRNDLIFNDVISALEVKRSPVLLTERRDHLEHFVQRFGRFTRNLIVLHGKMTRKERSEALSRMASVPEDEERLILSTGRYLGEGFDDARLDTLFIALPVSWRGTLVQYAGRLHRAHAKKREVLIYDYVDQDVPALRRMFDKRLRGYRALGYELEGQALRL